MNVVFPGEGTHEAFWVILGLMVGGDRRPRSVLPLEALALGVSLSGAICGLLTQSCTPRDVGRGARRRHGTPHPRGARTGWSLSDNELLTRSSRRRRSRELARAEGPRRACCLTRRDSGQHRDSTARPFPAASVTNDLRSRAKAALLRDSQRRIRDSNSPANRLLSRRRGITEVCTA